MTPGQTYRPDIDGLRALAVLAVLAYHAFPGALPGGFAGVDVFFVISGFLISGILLGELADGRFTFIGFYWRRVRRIFPALILVLIAVLALGHRVLLPDEYAELGKHVAAGAAFLSNIALWREAGYFDAAAETKPLLHLWSLGIEEQYYLFWPLLLFLFRRSRGATIAMVSLLALVSFALNVALIDRHPTAAFYLPATRFWELGIGSVLACLGAARRGGSRRGDAQSIAGVALIALSLVLLDAGRDFPGWWALLPVAGAALVIAAGPQAWANRRLFAVRPVVYVGLISYPLYLWHWPLIAFAHVIHGGEPPFALRLLLLAVSAVLAALTYELVEKPIRRGRFGLVARRAVPALLAGMALLCGVGALAKQGFVAPLSAANPMVQEIARASRDWVPATDTVIVGDVPKAVLFFGDSHMEHYLPRVREVVREHQAPLRTVIFKTEGGCAPVPGIERKHERCSHFVDEGFKLAHEPNVDTVVIAASWVGFLQRGDYYRVGDPRQQTLDLLAPSSASVFDAFQAELARLVAAGKHVVLVLSSPRGAAVSPKSMITRDWSGVQVKHQLAPLAEKDLLAVTGPIDARLARMALRAGATVLKPTDWLCHDGICPTLDARGEPIYMDDSHIRASVARASLGALDQFVYAEPGVGYFTAAMRNGSSSSRESR